VQDRTPQPPWASACGNWAALQGGTGGSTPSHGGPLCAPAAPAGLRLARQAAPRTPVHALWRPRRAPPARRSSGPAAPTPQTRRRPAHAPPAGVSSYATAAPSRTSFSSAGGERRSVFQWVPRWRRCNGCSRDSLMEDYSEDHVVMVHAVPADGANGRG